jgi:hypothetical protein
MACRPDAERAKVKSAMVAVHERRASSASWIAPPPKGCHRPADRLRLSSSSQSARGACVGGPRSHRARRAWSPRPADCYKTAAARGSVRGALSHPAGPLPRRTGGTINPRQSPLLYRNHPASPFRSLLAALRQAPGVRSRAIVGPAPARALRRHPSRRRISMTALRDVGYPAHRRTRSSTRHGARPTCSTNPAVDPMPQFELFSTRVKAARTPQRRASTRASNP